MGRDQSKFKAPFELIKGMKHEVLGWDPDISVLVKDDAKAPALITAMLEIGWHHYVEPGADPDSGIYDFSRNPK